MIQKERRFVGGFLNIKQRDLILKAAKNVNEKKSEYLRTAAEMRAKGTFNNLTLEYKALEYGLFQDAFEQAKSTNEAKRIIKLMILRGYIKEADDANKDLNFKINAK